MKGCADIPWMYRDKMPPYEDGSTCGPTPACCDACHDYHPDDMYVIRVDGEQYHVCCTIKRYFFPPTPEEEAEFEKLRERIFGSPTNYGKQHPYPSDPDEN